jgi:hypothetical protein
VAVAAFIEVENIIRPQEKSERRRWQITAVPEKPEPGRELIRKTWQVYFQ